MIRMTMIIIYTRNQEFSKIQEQDDIIPTLNYFTITIQLFIPFLVGQVRDLADKLESWDHNMSRGSYAIEREGSDKKTEDKLSKATKDSCKITTEVLHGIMTQVVKDKLFNCIQK